MRARMLALALALGGLAGPAAAQGGALAGCADPDLPARDTLTLCEQALRSPRLSPGQRAAVLVNLGVAQAALERHADAERSFGLAIQTDPGLVDAYGNRARSRMALGRTDEAMADFDAAIARDPARADLWLGRGAGHLRRDAPGAAVQDLTRAIGLDPRLAAAWFNRGIGYLLLDDPARAEADFSQALALDPGDLGALLNRARARSARDPRGAEADFDAVIAAEPDWGGAWYARGLFLDGQGRREEANSDFLRAWRLGVSDRWLEDRVRQLGGG